MTERLFVYGTLAPGQPNADKLSHLCGVWQPATVRGKLLQLGWGAEKGYPGIKLCEMGDKVDGFVFSSMQLSSCWSELDEFEGGEYERVLTLVTLQDGNCTTAYIYQIRDGST